MNKYKVEFTRTEQYVVDVLAKTEDEARTKAEEEFSEILAEGIEHYNQVGDDMQEITAVFDVTNTDDPFDPRKGGQNE